MRRPLPRLFAGLTGAVLAPGALLVLTAATEGGAVAGSPDASRKPSVEAAAPAPTQARIPPDPPPMSEQLQWVFDLRWENDEPYLVEVHALDMGEKHVTPRMMGRFAIELYEGPTLIERVRFDFPMLGAPPDPDAGSSWGERFRQPIRLETKLKTRIGVVFPKAARGTRLELWDRATDRRWPLPWPPHEGKFGPPRDAGAG